jgi:hypothetical protein
VRVCQLYNTVTTPTTSLRIVAEVRAS